MDVVLTILIVGVFSFIIEGLIRHKEELKESDFFRYLKSLLYPFIFLCTILAWIAIGESVNIPKWAINPFKYGCLLIILYFVFVGIYNMIKYPKKVSYPFTFIFTLLGVMYLYKYVKLPFWHEGVQAAFYLNMLVLIYTVFIGIYNLIKDFKKE